MKLIIIYQSKSAKNCCETFATHFQNIIPMNSINYLVLKLHAIFLNRVIVSPMKINSVMFNT